LWLGVRRVSGVLTEARRRGGQNVEFLNAGFGIWLGNPDD